MTLYMGVDFHPHQQTVCWMDQETGELRTRNLVHNRVEEVKAFYKGMRSATVGIEASSRSTWFEDLIFENGHTLVVGDPGLIRKRAVSRHKSDKRDAEHIFTLLVNGEFPALWRRPRESVHVLEVMRLRSSFVRQRTQVYNRLQAMAHEVGLRRGTMGTARFQELLKEAGMNEVQSMRRSHLFRLLESLSLQINEIDSWLKAKAEEVDKVRLLLTQSGVGYLTALCMVHTLGDVHRFARTRQITAFIGLDPLEKSSGGTVRFGHVSKAGSGLLRFLLGQSANIVIRHDMRLKSFYKRLSKKKPKAVAKTAVARKLAVKLSIMLRDSITAAEYDQRGCTAVDNARRNKGLKNDRLLMELSQPSSPNGKSCESASGASEIQ